MMDLNLKDRDKALALEVEVASKLGSIDLGSNPRHSDYQTHRHYRWGRKKELGNTEPLKTHF